MGYTALYRKFRPTTFSEMVGQDHITKTLKNQIMSNRVGHAYLLNGGRGTGKTSAAKILARAINCTNPQDGEPCNKCEICIEALKGSLTDIVEMDAASNNSVEDIRSIREEANFLPTKAKYRVYIIDEVHMLSTGAFNALLKTLEEPPSHVKFILATTEPQKLPATILSRCQRFDYKKISNNNIVKRLKIVCEESNLTASESALNIIATLSEGAMRDALSILERCVQDGENDITDEKIKELVGIPQIKHIHNIIENINEKNIENVIEEIEEILAEGKDITNIIWEMIKYVKDILIYKTTKKVEIYNEEEIKNIKELSEKISKEELIDLVYELSELEANTKWSTQKTIVFEAGLIKLCSNIQKSINSNNNQSVSNINIPNDILNRVEKIENYLKSTKINVNQNININNNTNTMVAQNSSKQNMTLNNNINRTNTKAQTKQKNFSNKTNEFWPQIVSDLKQSGKIVLYTSLIGTRATEVNDMTIGIEFPKEVTAFGKTVLNKQENIKEISSLVSMACGKEMQIKYIMGQSNNMEVSNEEILQNLANESDIPFNIVE